jgi:hypothetical protein
MCGRNRERSKNFCFVFLLLLLCVAFSSFVTECHLALLGLRDPIKATLDTQKTKHQIVAAIVLARMYQSIICCLTNKR